MDRFVPAWVALALLALGAGSGPVAAGETEYVQPSASAHTFLTTPASRRAYRQRAWAREQGLPDNCVLSLLQTRDGCVWVGTRKGLARFDGFQFTRINGAYAGAFASDQCTALAEGDDGTLWVGTDQGLIRLDGEGARRFDRADGLVSDSILALCHARNGDLWIGTAMGLHRRRGGRFESIPMASGRPVVQAWDLEIRALAEDAAGAVWFASRERVRRWEPQTDSIRDVTLPAGDSQFAMQITTDARTNVWLRGALVLRCLPDRTIVPLSDRLLVRSSDPAEGRENVSALLADRAGNLWLGWEESGLTCYRDGRITEFGARDGLSDDAVNCLMEDREENLWIGTRAGGLNCWQPRRFTVYTAGDGLPDNDTRTVCPARGGGVWIGTERGLSRLREDRFVRDPLPARLVDARVRSLHELADGTLWIGTMDSLERWQDGVLLPFRWVEASDANRVRVVTTDRAGTLWVGRNAGLLRWVGGAWTGFSRPDGLPHEDVRAVLEDRAGRLWIGTHGGGLCVAAATPTFRSLLTLTTTNGLTGNRVWVLHQDANGVVWAGTDAGLTRIDPGLPSPAAPAVPLRVSRFDRTQGLVDGPVNALVEDDQGRFWIGCDRGIYHVSRADLDDVAMGRETW